MEDISMSTTTTHRAVLAGIAAVPALAGPSIAAGAAPDPILAAIEAHRAANDAYDFLRCHA